MLTPEVFATQLADHNAAVAAAPDDANALKLRAAFYALHHDDKTLAIDDCRAALEMSLSRGDQKPNGVLARARLWLGRALGNTSGSFRFYFLAQAIAHFDVAARFKPGNATVYRDRARAWAQLRERERAKLDFDRMREIQGETRQSWLVQADAFSAILMLDAEAATAAFRRAIELKSSAPTLASCLRGASAPNAPHWQIMAYLDVAIELAPDATAPLLKRAALWTQTGELERSDADWNRALALQPDDPTIYEARAHFTERHRGFESAVADYAHALRLRIHADPALGTSKMLLQRARDLNDPAKRYAEDAQTLAIYNIAIEREPRRANLYVLRSALVRRMFDFDANDPFADEVDFAHPLLRQALEDEIHALWLKPRLVTPATRLVAHFAARLRGQSAHQQLEGLLEIRKLLTSKGLKKPLIESISAQIEARL